MGPLCTGLATFHLLLAALSAGEVRCRSWGVKELTSEGVGSEGWEEEGGGASGRWIVTDKNNVFSSQTTSEPGAEFRQSPPRPLSIFLLEKYRPNSGSCCKFFICVVRRTELIVLHSAEVATQPGWFVLFLLAAAQPGDLPVLPYRKRKCSTLNKQDHQALNLASSGKADVAQQSRFMWGSAQPGRARLTNCPSKSKAPAARLLSVVTRDANVAADMQSQASPMQNCAAVEQGVQCRWRRWAIHTGHTFRSKSKFVWFVQTSEPICPESVSSSCHPAVVYMDAVCLQSMLWFHIHLLTEGWIKSSPETNKLESCLNSIVPTGCVDQGHKFGICILIQCSQMSSMLLGLLQRNSLIYNKTLLITNQFFILNKVITFYVETMCHNSSIKSLLSSHEWMFALWKQTVKFTEQTQVQRCCLFHSPYCSNLCNTFENHYLIK